MDIDKAPLLEKFVDGVGGQGAHAEHGLEGVGPGPQMGDGAQELKAVALLLQGIVRGRGALHGDLCGLDLKGLLGLRRGHKGSLYNDGGSHAKLGYLGEVRQGVVVNHLHGLKIGSVADNDESERLGIPKASHPSSDGNLLVQEGLRLLINFSYSSQIHDCTLLLS